MKKILIVTLVFLFVGSYFIRASSEIFPKNFKGFYDQATELTMNTQEGKANSSVTESDSLALVALYNSTNGDIWRHNENWLSGQVSTWYGVTVTDGRVTAIDLSSNSMIGQLPAEIGNLNKLRALELNYNSIHGSIPQEIGSLDSLRNLYFYGNDLEGSIPASIGNLSELRDLRMFDNKLTGNIPVELYSLTNLEMLMLAHNDLTGNLSSEVGNLTKLTRFDVSDNYLEDSIPSEFANLNNLQYFYISNNYFSYLPDLSSMSALTNFYVEDNNLDFADLQMADVAGISFIYAPQRKIPVESTQTDDQIVFESLDEGVGNDYQWYKNDMAITADTLDTLSVNTSEDGAYFCRIMNDHFPDLTLQTIPQGVGDTSLTKGILTSEYNALLSLYDSTNGSGWYRSYNWKTGGDVEYWYGISLEGVHVTIINLGNNELEGSIPPQIAEFSQLIELQLDGNQLTGIIPDEIYDLSNLELLNLGKNQFTGSISPDLSNLSLLKKFTIHDNQLDGLPDFSSLNNLEFINIKENHFTFEDIEPNIGVSSGSFYYSPQAMIGEVVSFSPNTGAPVELSATVGGEQNVYQWYKDGSPVANSDSAVFTIQTFDTDSAGVYKCEITNNLATSLTLETKNMYVDVPIATYTISLNADPAGAGIVSGAGTYEDGETVVVEASSNEGYSFTGWNDGEDYFSYDSIYSFEATKNLNLAAVFEPLPSFSVTATESPVSAGAISGLGDYYRGETAVLEAVPENGYQFMNWTESDTLISNNPVLSVKIYRDRSFVAHFEELTAIEDQLEDIIKVYPNPVKDILIVKGIEEKAEIKLYDLQGRMVKAVEISKNHSLNLGHLSPGVYLLHIQIRDNNHVSKIIIDN
jgi:Leucine-rich repeat (LRR) protein